MNKNVRSGYSSKSEILSGFRSWTRRTRRKESSSAHWRMLREGIEYALKEYRSLVRRPRDDMKAGDNDETTRMEHDDTLHC